MGGSNSIANTSTEIEIKYSACVLFEPDEEHEFGSSAKVGGGLNYDDALALAKKRIFEMGSKAIGFCAVKEKTRPEGGDHV